jgi:hypothetical protein
MRTSVGLALAAILACSAQAQDSDYERLRSLPVEDAVREAGRLEGRSASWLDAGLMNYMARLSLANLGYAIDLRTPEAPLTDPETVLAVRLFEERARLNADGVLTFGELERLMRMADLSRLTRLSVGLGFHVSSSSTQGGRVFASGSWSMSDIAHPLNYSEITCDVGERVCEEKVIWVSGPSVTGSNADISTYVISSHTDHYEIDRWENGVLDATASSACRQTRLSINTRTELVTSTTQDLDPAGCPLPGSGQRFPRIEGLRVATLVSPWDAQTAHFEAINDAVNVVRGPAVERFRGSTPEP